MAGQSVSSSIDNDFQLTPPYGHVRLDAEKWARKIESEMDAGTFLDRSPLEKTTFGDLVKRYGWRGAGQFCAKLHEPC